MRTPSNFRSNAAAVIALTIASLTLPTLAHAKRMGGSRAAPSSINRAPAAAPVAAPKAPTAPPASTAPTAAKAAPAAAPAAPAAAAPAAAGPGLGSTLGAAVVTNDAAFTELGADVFW